MVHQKTPLLHFRSSAYLFEKFRILYIKVDITIRTTAKGLNVFLELTRECHLLVC